MAQNCVIRVRADLPALDLPHWGKLKRYPGPAGSARPAGTQKLWFSLHTARLWYPYLYPYLLFLARLSPPTPP